MKKNGMNGCRHFFGFVFTIIFIFTFAVFTEMAMMGCEGGSGGENNVEETSTPSPTTPVTCNSNAICETGETSVICPSDCAPLAPTIITATVRDGEIDVIWVRATPAEWDGATSYNICRSEGIAAPSSCTSRFAISGYNVTEAERTGSGQFSYRNTGVTRGHAYTYVVTAQNESERVSELSNSISAMVPAAEDAWVIDSLTVTASITHSRTMSLSWSNSGREGTSGYNIYRTTGAGVEAGEMVATLAPTYVDNAATTTYEDRGLTIGTTYYYVVTATTARDGGEQSLPSPRASGTPSAIIASDFTALALPGADLDNAGFGSSVAIDGDLAAVGAYHYNDGKGAVATYRRQDNQWNIIMDTSDIPSMLDETDFPAGVIPFTAEEQFGYSVALSEGFLVIGAPMYDCSADDRGDCGRIYMFNFQDDHWQYVTDLVPILELDVQCGRSVAVTTNNSGVKYIVTGCPGNNTADLIKARPPVAPATEWTITQFMFTAPAGVVSVKFGSSVAIDGNVVLVGDPDRAVGATANAGSIYFYTLNPADDSLTINGSSNGSGENGHFGYSVDVSGNYAIASFGDASTRDKGYELLDGNWHFDGASGVGASVAINSRNVMIGNPLKTVDTHDFAGGVLAFPLGMTFTEPTPPGPIDSGFFGADVDITDNMFFIIGAPRAAAGSAQGAAYIW